MTNQTSPRSYVKYVRHTRYARVRHAKQFKRFLAETGVVLGGAGDVFDELHDDHKSADIIRFEVAND